MNVEEVIKLINPIFIDVMENEKITLNSKISSKDIEEWDSITYVQLIVVIEKYFKIKFTALEVQNFKNVGEICESIIKRLKK